MKHSGDLGDVVYSLPCVKALAGEDGQVEMYLRPSESDHPFGGKHFTRDKIEWLTPLLKAQYYISAVHVWDGQEVDLDLDLFRKLNVNFAAGDIAGWYRWAFSVEYDLAEPWLCLGGKPSNKIIVNRTERYRNPSISYRFLTGQKVQFVGLDHEFEEFVRLVPDAEHLIVKDALVLAQHLLGCRAFIGGQSAVYAIAEAVKCPRVLEVCPSCPNVIPHGQGGHDAVTQLGFQWNIERVLSTPPGPPGMPAR